MKRGSVPEAIKIRQEAEMSKFPNDGYIRMTLSEFYLLKFRPLMCMQDVDLLDEFWSEGVLAVSAGYYELICDATRPTASIGCTWYVMPGQLQIKIEKDDVNSNIMLVDELGHDYGVHYTRSFISNWLHSGTRQHELEPIVVNELGTFHRAEL